MAREERNGAEKEETQRRRERKKMSVLQTVPVHHDTDETNEKEGRSLEISVLNGDEKKV